MPEGLEVKNCSVKYPGVETKALRKLSFKIRRGSFLVISGASGSGKTTLLRSIAGLVDLCEGSIAWRNNRVEGPSEKLVPGYDFIRLVAQELDLQEKMTVRENLRHALRAYAEPYKSERVEELIKICRLHGMDQRAPYQLSGGQRQRVVWAINLAEEPELLLLDEPFSHLDVMLKAEMTHLLQAIQSELNITVIMVTHDPAEALSLGQQVLLLKNGKLQMLDTPGNVYHKPNGAYAAGFFGETNIFSQKEVLSMGIKKQKPDARHWLLRPEHVVLSSDEDGLEATVVSCLFRGFYHLITLSTSGGVEIKAISARHLKKGYRCHVKIPPAKLHPLLS